MWRVLFLMLLLAFALAGCGGGQVSPARPAADTPEAVHEGWVAAVQADNHDALLALAAEKQFKAAFVDDNLGPLRSFVKVGKYGALVKAEPQPLTDDGAGKIGVSVWTFERNFTCYHTILAAQGGAWKVTSWGVMAHCPEKKQDDAHALAP
jgi:hypothetical protein